LDVSVDALKIDDIVGKSFVGVAIEIVSGQVEEVVNRELGCRRAG